MPIETHMRTLTLCLSLSLALTSWSVAAEEQAKAPKKVTKTSSVKRAANPVVSQNFPARKKVIKPAATKPVIVPKKISKARNKPVEVKSSDTKRAQERKSVKTAALKPAANAMAKEQVYEPKNVRPALVKPEKRVPPRGPAANELFGSVSLPAPLASRSIGSYTNGCLAGGVELPMTGEAWQVMRPSRNRNWGNPRLID